MIFSKCINFSDTLSPKKVLRKNNLIFFSFHKEFCDIFTEIKTLGWTIFDGYKRSEQFSVSKSFFCDLNSGQQRPVSKGSNLNALYWWSLSFFLVKNFGYWLAKRPQKRNSCEVRCPFNLQWQIFFFFSAKKSDSLLTDIH